MHGMIINTHFGISSFKMSSCFPNSFTFQGKHQLLNFSWIKGRKIDKIFQGRFTLICLFNRHQTST